MKKNILIILLFTFISNLYSQENRHPDAILYIEKYKDIAIAEMKRANIPASITLAQGLYESGFGKSELASQTNNHFGIKCHENWTGKTFKYTDDAPNECFRVYPSVEQSYVDHSDFLMNRKRYANLFLLDVKDYKGWAYGLKAAGYATNPKYPESLIKYINLYELYKFDDGTHISYQKVDEKKQKTEQFLSTPITVEPPKEKTTEYVEINTPNSTINTNKKEEKKQTATNDNEISKTNTPNTKPKTKKIYEQNKLKAVKIYKDESLKDVSNSLKINLEDLMDYNDIEDKNIVLENQYLYIENKKTKSKTATHKVRQNDNMWSIAQKYGIQLSSLLKMNNLEKGEEPKTGAELVLKGKNKVKPTLRPIQIQTENIVDPISKQSKSEIKKNTTTLKDTIYPNLNEKHKTSVDSNTILEWEDAKKLVENKPIKPYPKHDENVDANINKGTESKEMNTEETATVIATNKITTTQDTQTLNGKHLVVKGDTLYNISNRYNITITNLIEWNNIQNNIIKLGTYLQVAP
jgi:LysM repeat protein